MLGVAIKNCARCARLFTGVEEICPTCLSQEQEEFEKVKEYLAGHGNATVVEVSSRTGVEIAQIHRWLRAGRLKMTLEQLQGALRCERCGAPIDSGRFCPRCLSELNREISRAATRGRPDEPPQPGAPDKRPEPAQKPEPARRQAKVHTIGDVKRRFG